MEILSGITIEEFELLPDALAHNHELVDGELIDVSGNTFSHNSLRDLLVRLLAAHVDERKLGKIVSEQEFEFNGNAHGPDVSFIKAEKVPLIDRRKRVQLFVPDLAIEIVSESDRFKSLMVKAARYKECGTQEVWVLSPDTGDIFALSQDRKELLDDSKMFKSKLIPGFSIRFSDLFKRAES